MGTLLSHQDRLIDADAGNDLLHQSSNRLLLVFHCSQIRVRVWHFIFASFGNVFWDIHVFSRDMHRLHGGCDTVHPIDLFLRLHDLFSCEKHLIDYIFREFLQLNLKHLAAHGTEVK